LTVTDEARPGRARSLPEREEDRLEFIGPALRAAARRVGTPCYVTDVVSLGDSVTRVSTAFPDPWVRSYSLKANDLPALVGRLAAAGFGANVVSRGEWDLARRAGVPNAAITLEGIGKSDADLRAAARAAADGQPLRWVSLESTGEAAALARIVRDLGVRRGQEPVRVDVLVRVNPAVEPETQAGLATGAVASKFGVEPGEVGDVMRAAGGTDGPLRFRGLHLHVGSQLGAVDAWRDAIRRAAALLALHRGRLPDFDTLDLGGGFPVAPLGVWVPGPDHFAAAVAPLLEAIPSDRRPRRLAIEPGRFLVARAGWLVARVLHVRDRAAPLEEPAALDRSGPLGLAVVPPEARAADRVSRLVVVDAGMTELLRPALYGAEHGLVALTSHGRAVLPRRPAARPGMSASWRAAAEDRRSLVEAGARAAGVPARRDEADLSTGWKLARVDGPICESTDRLGEHRLPHLRRGDLVAIRDTGAYGAAMRSAYNGRPRPPEVFIEPDGSLVIARRRGSLATLG
jgi:diaminopimelate decarboxylase